MIPRIRKGAGATCSRKMVNAWRDTLLWMLGVDVAAFTLVLGGIAVYLALTRPDGIDGRGGALGILMVLAGAATLLVLLLLFGRGRERETMRVLLGSEPGALSGMSGLMLLPPSRYIVAVIIVSILLGTPVWILYDSGRFLSILHLLSILFTFVGILMIAPAWLSYLGSGTVVPARTRVVLGFLSWGIVSTLPVIVLAAMAMFVFGSLFHPATAALLFVSVVALTPLLEEPAKAMGLLLMHRRIGSEIEGLLYGAACGVGFAIMENALYLSMNADQWPLMMLMRTFGSATGHVFGSSMVGFFIGRYKRLGRPRHLLLVGLGILLALLGHGVWNLAVLLLSEDIVHVGAALPLLTLFVGMLIALAEFLLMRAFLRDPMQRSLVRYSWVMSHIEKGKKGISPREASDRVKAMSLSGMFRKVHSERRVLLEGEWRPEDGTMSR